VRDELRAATLDDVRIVVVDDVSARHALTDGVRVCAQARFCTRDLHEWLMRSLRLTPQDADRGDGLDYRTLHLPPGGRWALRFISDWRVMRLLNRVGAYKIFAAADVGLLRRAPMVVAVVGRSDAASQLTAGRLIQRIWCELNGRGLAVHPYYAATDQFLRLQQHSVPPEWTAPVSNAIAALSDLLGVASGEMVHMMLRVGWPTAKPPLSRRLPLEHFLRDETTP
jgi:hypothetical protein